MDLFLGHYYVIISHLIIVLLAINISWSSCFRELFKRPREGGWELEKGQLLDKTFTNSNMDLGSDHTSFRVIESIIIYFILSSLF